MRRLALLASLLALPACKKKDEPAPVAKVADAAAAVAKPADAGVSHPGERLAVAPLPGASNAATCTKDGEYVTATLRALAVQQKVPEAKADDAAKQLSAAWIASCSKGPWPQFVVDCFDKAPNDAVTFQRCIDRLPGAARADWDTAADAIFDKLGGTAPAHPGHVAGETPPEGGVKFEDLCGTFVAEIARLTDCAGPGMYVPALEEVFRDGRVAEVGGVIPKESQQAVKTLCDQRTAAARDIEAQVCPKLLPP
jgi:hypothetical protein